jgi:hypothetical protein
MSMVLSSFAEGIKAVWRNKSLVGIVFVFKFAFSFMLLLPFYIIFSASFGRNVKALNFLEQLDISLLIDFLYHWRKILPIYFGMFVLVCIIGMLVFVFLCGGLWGVLRDRIRRPEGGFSMEGYFGYCGKYFWAFLRLSLLLLVLYLIALFVFVLFSAVFDAVAGESNLLEITSWRVLIKMFIGLVLFFFVNMIGDYLRIFLVENEGERFSAVLRKGLNFVLTKLTRALSLYYLLTLILVVAIGIYVGIHEVLSRMPPIGFFIFTTFLIQQTFVLFFSFYRLVYYSSQLTLYERIYQSVNRVA